MLLASWRRKGIDSLERWLAWRETQRQRSLARTRPFLEVLEDRLVPAGFTTLYNFAPGGGGWYPVGGVVLDGSGNLDGMTDFSTVGGGTAYQFNLSSNALTTLHAFTNATGVGPQGTPVRDSSGNLYGTTTTGGTNNFGTVFRLSADGSSYTVLHNFTGSDGWSPQGNLLRDSQGDLFGTTYIGTGAASDGTVYELSPNGTGGYNFTTLHVFAGGTSDGNGPVNGLYMDSKGNLYGTTKQGGAFGAGTVFELSPNGTGGYNTSIIHSFKASSEGAFPVSGVIMDTKGNLYGTTAQGGANALGSVYELSPNGTGGYNLTTLYNFTGPDGTLPQDTLFMDSKGNLFGTALQGGANNDGSVFELSPSGSGGYNFTTLYSFSGADGANPIGPLTADASGNLYGTASSGGSQNGGTIFEITGAAAGAPTITSSTAYLPANSSTMVINGTNFDSNAANDSVTFDNGVTGSVTSATSTRLIVSLSGLGNVIAGAPLHASVMVNGTSSGNPVQVATIAPAITSSAANLPATATTMVLNGGGFDSNPANDKVVFDNGVSNSVISATATSLTVSLSSLTGLSGGTVLHAFATVDGLSSGSAVQVATIAPVVTSSTANLPADSTSMFLQGDGFDTNAANDKVTFDNGVTGTVASATANTLTVNLTGLGSVNAGTALHARATVNNISSGSLVQVATVSPSSTTTAASSATAFFNQNTQNVTLTANVTSSARTVNEGTVTFTLLQGTTVIGNPKTSGTVSNGVASVSYTLPANTAVGSYTIQAVYNAGPDFTSSSDASHTLTISTATTKTTASSSSVSFSDAAQNVTLSANVTSAAGTVNEGTVTFTLLQGTTVVGTATTSSTVNNGQASVSYVVPAGTALGSYTIQAVYNPGPDFGVSSDSAHALTVLAASTTTSASNASATFSESSQNITLTASVTSPTGPVDEGTVTFLLLQGNNVVGLPTTSSTVNNGAASVSYVLPASLTVGSYTIHTVYNPSANFTNSFDNGHTLTVSAATTTTTANNLTDSFNGSTQTVTLTANVTSNAGPVNEGTVTFTLLQGTTVVGAATTSGTVNNGAASVSYALPPGAASGNYTIKVVYNPGTHFLTSTDNSHTLTVIPDNVASTANNTLAVYSPNQTTVFVSASVADTTHPSAIVNEGTITFTVLKGTTPVGSVSTNVSGGKASTTFNMPAGEPAGTYTIAVAYTDSLGNFTDKSDTPAVLTNTAAHVATTADDASISVASTSIPQDIPLSATVLDTSLPQDQVNEGWVTFTILNGSTPVGTTQGNVLGGKASATFTLPAGSPATDYTITVSYNDNLGNFRDGSDVNAALSVEQLPTINTNPTNQTVTAGGSATFTAAADGNPTPTVQWQVSTDGGRTFNNINGATTSTLTVSNVSFASNGNEYRAIFTSTQGTATSSAATLTVQTLPALTSGNTATFTVGQSSTFLVTATGIPTPTLRVSGGLPSGVTFIDNGNGTATLGGIPAAGTAATYHFVVMAHNGAGSDAVQNFTLTVNPASVTPTPASSTPASSQPLVLKVPFLLSLFDQLFGGIETINANKTETVTDSMLGIPLLVSTYDSSGNLISVTMLGFNVTSLFV